MEAFPSAPRDPFWHQLLVRRPELAAGKLTLTDDPGFGIDIDWKLVDRWRI